MPTVLLVEDNPGDARLIMELLRGVSDLANDYTISHVERVNDAIQILQSGENIDIILSDITLPDSRGTDTLRALNNAADEIPIIFMTGTNDMALAIAAINMGAQDYLVKGKVDTESLSKALSYATERKKFQNEMNKARAKQERDQQRISLLAEQKKQLIKLNHSKDDFISIASHQLRTPASAVKQYVGMVVEGFAGDVSDQQMMLLKKAYESNERQLTVINELLKTAQLDSSKIKIDLQPTSLNTVIAKCVDDVQPAIDMREQQLSVQLGDDVTVQTDHNEFQLVIANVLENASKYTPRSKAISIATKTGRGHVQISIKDEGVGISPQNQKVIFEKFSRIDNDLSDTVQGSGLGLYWVRRIMRLHKGSISVHSDIGQGSEFILELPCTIK